MEFEVDINTVIDIYTELCERFDDGEAEPDILNEYELTIYVTQTLESEVNNGGFIQFFDNAGGAFADEIVPAFKRIGARKRFRLLDRGFPRIGRSGARCWIELLMTVSASFWRHVTRPSTNTPTTWRP